MKKILSVENIWLAPPSEKVKIKPSVSSCWMKKYKVSTKFGGTPPKKLKLKQVSRVVR